MARLLSLLLTLALVASIVIPGDVVSHCEGMGEGISAAVGCCPSTVQPAEESCCCLDQPAPAPTALPTIDRHWLVEGVAKPLTASVAILWSYTPANVPAGSWRASPVLPFGGAPPPRERSCIILT